jgi:DNA modification methylase
MINHQLVCGDCIEYLDNSGEIYDTVFADPPDNIGLKYNSFKDRKSDHVYLDWIETCLDMFMRHSRAIWVSYNARWTFKVAAMVIRLLNGYPEWSAKPCVQVFTFGQHNRHDLGNNHRPLIRLLHDSVKLHADAIRIPSWRQEHGDPRADPKGRVPGDVFDFPRVTGNSKQRRSWHPTQLHEGLVERCIKLTTPEGGTVLDPFAGTGTVLRVCKRLEIPCTSIEIDPAYCDKIFREHQQCDLARGSLAYIN